MGLGKLRCHVRLHGAYIPNQPGFPSEGGDIPACTLLLVFSRALDGGLHEQFNIINYGRAKLSFNLEITVRSDLVEVESGRSHGYDSTGR